MFGCVLTCLKGALVLRFECSGGVDVLLGDAQMLHKGGGRNDQGFLPL